MTSIEYADIEDRITSISSDALIELFAIVIDDPMVDFRTRRGCGIEVYCERKRDSGILAREHKFAFPADLEARTDLSK